MRAAVERAGARRFEGATLYVTLEPCCHWGKTPPCTEAILAAGISRVVVAMIDPFSEVKGKGARLLRCAGWRSTWGCWKKSARLLNRAFMTRLTKGRPYVIAKWARVWMGAWRWRMGSRSGLVRRLRAGFVQTLRGRMDAIIVGIGTVRADDPLLMARPEGGAGYSAGGDADCF